VESDNSLSTIHQPSNGDEGWQSKRRRRRRRGKADLAVAHDGAGSGVGGSLPKQGGCAMGSCCVSRRFFIFFFCVFFPYFTSIISPLYFYFISLLSLLSLLLFCSFLSVSLILSNVPLFFNKSYSSFLSFFSSLFLFLSGPQTILSPLYQCPISIIPPCFFFMFVVFSFLSLSVVSSKTFSSCLLCVSLPWYL